MTAASAFIIQVRPDGLALWAPYVLVVGDRSFRSYYRHEFQAAAMAKETAAHTGLETRVVRAIPPKPIGEDSCLMVNA